MKIEINLNKIEKTCECGRHLSQLIIDGYDLTPHIRAESEQLRELLALIYVAVLPRIKSDDVDNLAWSRLEQIIDKATSEQPFTVPRLWPR